MSYLYPQLDIDEEPRLEEGLWEDFKYKVIYGNWRYTPSIISLVKMSTNFENYVYNVLRSNNQKRNIKDSIKILSSMRPKNDDDEMILTDIIDNLEMWKND